MGKKKISVTLREDQVGEISDLVGEEYESRSEAVRELIDRGLRYEDLERERDRLDRELAQLLDQCDEHRELVAYVENERSWREQPLSTRLKWWVFGQPP